MRLLTLFLLLRLTFALHTISKTVTCPCTVTVSSRVTQPLTRFDLLFTPLFSTIPDPSLSLFRQSDFNATHSDAIFHYLHHQVSNTGTYNVTLRTQSPNSHDLLPRVRQITCPIIIPRDRPPVRTLNLHKASRQGISILPPDDNPPTSATPKIVGGGFASSTLAPYMVALADPDERICTGTLISAEWVMTAAHCNISEEWVARIMSTQALSNGRKISIAEVYNHPKYSPDGKASRFDIAVVRLATSVSRFNVKFMRLNFGEMFPEEGAFARMIGYGIISYNNVLTDSKPQALRQVDVPIASHRTCRKAYSALLEPYLVSRKFQFCAGYILAGGCDTCQGDSGGPVIQYAGKRPVLMGLASTGVECGRRGYPGVNTRVSAFRSWLDSTPAVYKPYEGNVTQQRASCPAGEFLNSFGGEPATCAVCPPGSVSPEGVSRACFSCPGNSSPDPFDFGKCSCRAVLGMGYVSSDGGGCEVCRPGTFSAFGSNRCADCRRGSYAKGSGNAECLPCPKAPRRSKRCPSA